MNLAVDKYDVLGFWIKIASIFSTALDVHIVKICEQDELDSLVHLVFEFTVTDYDLLRVAFAKRFWSNSNISHCQ